MSLKKLGVSGSFIIFGSAALLMFCMTRYAIPYLSAVTGLETILWWFLVAGIGIFTPLILTGILILKAEGYKISKETWTERLRFRKISKSDMRWCIAGLVLVGILSGLTMKLLEAAVGTIDHSPTFMSFEPLNKGRYWLLLIWAPYWVLNILGEEFIWRGVLLPRQEIAFGKNAWLIHGLGWALFHIAFGWQLFVTLIPLLFIQSYIVQKTKNSWVGVIMHGALNGPSFMAISFGLI